MQPADPFDFLSSEPEESGEDVNQLEMPLRAGGVEPETQQELLSDAVRRAEAVLFAAGEPLSAEQISQILPHGIEAPEVLMQLRSKYANSGVVLTEVAGKWRFQTAQDLQYLFVEERQVQKKLGQAALETMAIIAYGQPVTRAEIEAVRGVAVSKSTLDTLLETGWVKYRGRRKTPGQPMTFGTTDAFLEHFGLESLDTLPGKADLEAEGLLTDVIPTGFQMPDEEALSEEDTAIVEADDPVDDEAFVTDFMGDDEAENADADDEVETLESDVTAAEDVIDDKVAGGDPDPVAVDSEATDHDDDDEYDHESGVSVFAYTKEPGANEAEGVLPDAEALDDDAVKAAVIKLAATPRAPERKMGDWDDEE